MKRTFLCTPCWQQPQLCWQRRRASRAPMRELPILLLMTPSPRLRRNRRLCPSLQPGSQCTRNPLRNRNSPHNRPPVLSTARSIPFLTTRATAQTTASCRWRPTRTAQPNLNQRAYMNDPDGDIVHPEPLPPGTLGEGTTIRVRLLDRLSTADSRSGDRFRTRVASDVVQDGQVLIPAGAEIDGTVVEGFERPCRRPWLHAPAP